MLNSQFKTSIPLLLGISFLLFPSKNSFAQGYLSLISWHHDVYEARVEALGQSSAALFNGSTFHMNPAVPLESGVVNSSSFLLSNTLFRSDFLPEGIDLYNPAISYSDGQFSFAASLDYTNQSDTFTNSLFRLHAGYRITNNFSLGGGLSHSIFKIKPNDNYTLDNYRSTAWGISVGAYYQNSLESNYFHISPQLGFTLNDISSGFQDDWGTMPGQIRLGLGLDISSKYTRLNQSVWGGGIYSGFAKYLSRPEQHEDLFQARIPSGFEAIFTTWNSYRISAGIETEEVSLAQQISRSIGVELQFMNTLFLRYGIVGGAERWMRPQHGIGVELNLYYVSLAITHMNYRSSRHYISQNNKTSVQTTFRIPVDGQPRDTLLGRLLDR
jgi:hypothetical protein